MTLEKTKREYSIQVYDPSWTDKFQEIKNMLDEIFGDKAISIEHVGSTSIPNMRAKPIIDVLIIVEKMEEFENEKAEMIKKGYEWDENLIAPNTQIFYKTEGNSKTKNIHLCIKDSPSAKQFIQTRDYLRAHPERAKAYGDLKEKLKAEFPDDYPAYRAGKKGFLDETERLSYEWVEKSEI